MASTSLGTLTLDLAVRLSEFTDGLSRAERETRDRTENMSDSVASFKNKMIEDLSGTPIGSAIDSLNEKLASITDAFGEGGLAGAAKLGAAAVIGSMIAIGAGLVSLALETAEADKQLVILSDRANTTTRNLQVLSAAAGNFGLDMEGVTDVLADAREKFGEFSANGAGGLIDTLELLQKSTKMTDAEITKFAREITTVDTVDAIQMVQDALTDANATTQEARFVNESLASGLDDIAPVFDNYGRILKEVDSQLEQTGVIRTQESIKQSQILAQQVQDTTVQFNGLKNQLVTATLPAISSLISYMSGATSGSKDMGSNLSVVGSIANGLARFIIGLSTSFKTVAYTIAGAGLALDAFKNLAWSVLTNPLDARLHVNEFKNTIVNAINYAKADIQSAWMSGGAAIDKLYNPEAAKLVNGSSYNGGGTGSGGSDYDTSSTKANTAAVKANTKTTADASKYIQYANSGSTRNQRLNSKLEQALSFLQDEGITFKVNSGGQAAKGSGGKRVGSTAHDNGYAADGDLYKGGRKLDWNNAKDLPLLKAVVEEAAARGINGIGAGNDYMGAGRFHFGMQQNAYAWGGKNKKASTAHVMPWVKAAHAAGNNRKGSGTFYGKAMAEEAKESKKASDDAQREQEKRDAEALRAQEALERAKLSIIQRYATDAEKIENDHADNLRDIKATYAANSDEYRRYMADEAYDYEVKKNAAAQSVMAKYMSEEEKLLREHELALKEITDANIPDKALYQKFVDEQNAAYQKDLANFRFAAQAKLREQDKLYQSIADNARANGINAVSTGLDAMAQRTMSDKDYQGWRLAQDHDEAFDSVNNQYSNRQAEINAVDERGDYSLPELERFELLEIAKQEHLEVMWSMEQEYALRQQTLDEQQAAQRVAIYQGLFAGMTNAASIFFGENSKMHKIAFAMEQAYAVHKALMNVEETYSNTFNSLSAIPLIGPYIAAPGAAVAAGLQVASAARIQGMSAPSVAGIAHGGLDNVPEEATYLLQKDERVLSPKQNKDLVKFMSQGQSSGAITINNNSGAQVSASRAPNGEVTIEMVDKMMDKRFRRIGKANSLESKAIQRGTTARVNRS